MTRKTRIPNPAFDHRSDFVVNASPEKKQEIKQKTESLNRNLVLHSKYTLAELAIGKKSRKYIAIFKKISKGNFFITNTSAGIFGLAWLIYRKAAFYGFLAYLALVLVGYELFTKIAVLPKEMQLVAIFGFTHLVFYFIGNFIYFYSVTSKISNAKEKYGDTSAITYLSEEGGTLSGFMFITPVFLLQGGMLCAVVSCLYVDEFLVKIWQDFLALAGV